MYLTTAILYLPPMVTRIRQFQPIFMAAGRGIKENYVIDRYIREVDVAPTAAVLIGVDFPAQCEGAPAYQIFSEKL